MLGVITECRLCSSTSLDVILSLGFLEFTGVFPARPEERGEGGELTLVLCESCTLVQLDRSFPPEKMYGEGYGYRSSLNQSMVNHLASHAQYLQEKIGLSPSDVICDIGSNDGTFLNSFQQVDARNKIGIDPAAEHLSAHYTPGTLFSPTFFSRESFENLTTAKASLVTSIAMFYDLEDPVEFALDIASILKPGGFWFLEQSYMPWMVQTGAYDTICHEHIEYYSLKSIREIFKRSGFELVDAFTTPANGGSLAVLARKNKVDESVLTPLDLDEESLQLGSVDGFSAFKKAVGQHRQELPAIIQRARSSGKRVAGLGASTKGSVILQWCGLDNQDIDVIGEVNPDKVGKLMAGTSIPIVEESKVFKDSYESLLVLPWHFRSTFVNLVDGMPEPRPQLIFPLPNIDAY